MPVETRNKPVDFYVLTQGEMFGPYALEELAAGLRKGQFSAGDFVQSGDLPIWQPLAHVAGGAADELSGAIVPEWKSILSLVRLRLRYSLREQSIQTGVVCLLAAALAMGLSRWPFVFWMPWLALTVWAAIVLIRRRHELTGTLLLLGVLAVPFADAYLASRSAWPNVTRVPSQESAPVALVAAVPETRPLSTEESSTVPNAPAQPIAPVAEAATPPAATSLPELPAGIDKIAVGKLSEPATVAPVPATAAIASPATVVPPWEKPPAPWEKTPAILGPEPQATESNKAELVQSHTDAFVIIKGQEGSGSGFICRAGKQTWLFTNIHVVADIQKPTFMRLDNVPVVPGAAEAAGGPDIVRYALAQAPAHPLELMTDVDTNVRIGDEVIVLGNSGGGGVVTSLTGVVRGIGPDRLEVSAEFIPGNSGSPIVHVKTGKVIGIATYLTRRYEEFAPKSGGNPPSATPAPRSSPSKPSGGGEMVVRRFGYRIDTVSRWESVNWAAFRAEAAQVQQVSRLTEDIVGFLGAMRTRVSPNYQTETLRRPATIWLGKIRSKYVSESDRLSATQLFLGQLRSMARSDIQNSEANLRYTYFVNDLRDEKQTRERLYDAFNAESASLASPVGRTGYR